jgi:hypothetical protein
MKETLVGIHQQRMDRCQSEQYWAIAALAATNAFVLSEKEAFLAYLSRESLLAVLCLLSVACTVFVIARLHSYYLYRNDLADLISSEDKSEPFFAPKYIKEKKDMLSGNGTAWILVFCVFIFLPFVGQLFILKP